jgi:hypothetical protein
MRKRRFNFLTLLILVLGLSGCGVASQNVPSTTASPAATSAAALQPSATRAAATATPNPTLPATDPQPTGESAVPDLTPIAELPTVVMQNEAPDDLVEQARQRLAATVGVDADRMELVASSVQDWSDASLGCPDPAAGYAQVIVPGYLLIFRSGDTVYDVHTSRTGRPMVYCRAGLPVLLDDLQLPAEDTLEAPPEGQPAPPLPPMSVTDDATMQRMTGTAREALAQDLGVASDMPQLVEREAVTWRDGSLGCPQPGMDYAQVLIEGFRFVFDVEGMRYAVHTDLVSQAVVCR